MNQLLKAGFFWKILAVLPVFWSASSFAAPATSIFSVGYAFRDVTLSFVDENEVDISLTGPRLIWEYYPTDNFYFALDYIDMGGSEPDTVIDMGAVYNFTIDFDYRQTDWGYGLIFGGRVDSINGEGKEHRFGFVRHEIKSSSFGADTSGPKIYERRVLRLDYNFMAGMGVGWTGGLGVGWEVDSNHRNRPGESLDRLFKASLSKSLNDKLLFVGRFTRSNSDFQGLLETHPSRDHDFFSFGLDWVF